MARPENKYERFQAGRRRLERLYDQGVNDWYPCGVTFLVLDNECGEDMYDMYHDCYGCKYRCYYDKSIGKYITWERPVGVKYTAKKYYKRKHSGQQNVTTYYKRVSNKRLRRTEDRYKGNQYRKVFDYWWILY